MSTPLNEERLRKFKEMGLPEPMAPLDPSTVQGPVRNLDFAAKLAALKSGQKRQELSTFIEKATPAAGFVPLEVPVPKNQKINEQTRPIDPRKPAVPELKTHAATGPSFDLYEKVLYGDDRAVAAISKSSNEPDPLSENYVRASSVVTTSRGYSSDVEDTSPANFFDSIKQKLAEKNSRASQTQRIQESGNPQRKPDKPEFDEEQIREYITEISSGVCKKLIKQFMSEYLTSEPGLIKESDKIKKAEVIREDIVKIDGKFFKLTPVQIKKKK